MHKELLREAAMLCLDNTEQYIKDAEALVRISSFGHAFALAVLAEEEIAKAYLCYVHAESGSEIKGRWRKILTNHRAKQALQHVLTFGFKMRFTVFDVLDSVKGEIERGDVTENQAKDRAFRRLIEYPRRIMEEGSPESEEWDECLRWFETMQKDKEKALYVDINFEKGEVSSPKYMAKGEVQKYLSQVRERFEMTRFILSQPLSPEKRLQLRKSLPYIYSLVKKDNWIAFHQT